MSDDLSDGPINYDRLRAATTTLRRPLKSLYVLDHHNDPFGVEAQGRRQRAEWIANLWPQLGFTAGVHIRRVHYKLVSLPELATRHNGERYENTDPCWNGLINAIRDARFLGLLVPNAIIDRRNPHPMIYFTPMLDRAAVIERKSGWTSCLAPEGHLPGFGIHVAKGNVTVPLPEVPELPLRATLFNPSLTLPGLALAHPPSITERYMLEIWVEKTTMNDVIVPLGERLHVNVITGAGDMSATQCEQFVERARRSGKPVRVLYVSDFDPSGLNMPVAVARKIEFALHNLSGKKPDVQVRAIALTAAQCVEYQLPRVPLKESERRAAKWEARHGAGATELDALEAIHPGALARILRDEITRYRDETIDRRIRDAAAEFRRQLETVNTEIRARHADEIGEVEAAIRAAEVEIGQMREELAAVVDPMREELANMTNRIRQELTTLADRMRQELAQTTEQLQEEAERVIAPMREALEHALERIGERVTQIGYNLRGLAEPIINKMQTALSQAAPTYDWPQPIAQEDDDPLYDSKRGYIQQLDRFRAHQGKVKPTKLITRPSYQHVCTDCGKNFTSGSRDAVVCKGCYGKHWKRKKRRRVAMQKG
jgi:hypothetical protein